MAAVAVEPAAHVDARFVDTGQRPDCRHTWTVVLDTGRHLAVTTGQRGGDEVGYALQSGDGDTSAASDVVGDATSSGRDGRPESAEWSNSGLFPGERIIEPGDD